jgi:hypothetical protein
MFRKCAIALSIVLLVFTTACSTESSSATSAATSAGAVGVPASASAGTACPTHNTRSFAKTRFVLDAGLAAGAFKKWIYTPYEHGAFKKGANGRVKAIAKAAVAGTFVVNRLLAAKKNAMANPTLCKVAVVPMQKLTNSVKGLVAKSKSGNLNGSDVSASDATFDQFRSVAANAGAAVKEQNASIPGLG